MLKFLGTLLILPLVYSIVCYHGMNVAFPGNILVFNETIRVCRNGNFCMRVYGKMNGQDAWFAGCVKFNSSENTCPNGNNGCVRTVAGNALHTTDYTTCCCQSDFCNDINLVANDTNTASSPSTNSVSSYTMPSSVISSQASTSQQAASTSNSHKNSQSPPTTEPTHGTKAGDNKSKSASLIRLNSGLISALITLFIIRLF